MIMDKYLNVTIWLTKIPDKVISGNGKFGMTTVTLVGRFPYAQFGGIVQGLMYQNGLSCAQTC